MAFYFDFLVFVRSVSKELTVVSKVSAALSERERFAKLLEACEARHALGVNIQYDQHLPGL